MQTTKITIQIKACNNPVMVIFDQPDYRDSYESFDFWNCDIFQVIDTGNNEQIGHLLSYEDYKEIFEKLFKQLEKQ